MLMMQRKRQNERCGDSNAAAQAYAHRVFGNELRSSGGYTIRQRCTWRSTKLSCMYYDTFYFNTRHHL